MGALYRHLVPIRSTGLAQVPPSVAHRGGSAGSEGLVSPETHPGFRGSTLVPFSQNAGFRISSARAGALEVAALQLEDEEGEACAPGWAGAAGAAPACRGSLPLKYFGWCLPCRSPVPSAWSAGFGW